MTARAKSWSSKAFTLHQIRQEASSSALATQSDVLEGPLELVHLAEITKLSPASAATRVYVLAMMGLASHARLGILRSSLWPSSCLYWPSQSCTFS